MVVVVTVAQGVFPSDVLVGCDTALVIFCAAFGGKQDAHWIAEAGLTATCVDEDGKKMDEMWRAFPEHWEFVTADAYEFAAHSDRQWDVVTLDPFTHDFERCADCIEMWCRLARRAVVIGTGNETVVEVPAGWQVSAVLRRSDYQGGVFWTVLERA